MRGIWARVALATALAGPATAQEIPPAEDWRGGEGAAPGRPALGLVYSGGLGGLAPARLRMELQDRLRPSLAAAGIAIDAVDVLHGVIAQGDLEIWPEDGRVASALAYAAGAATCDEGVIVDTARTPTERFLPAPGSPALPVPDAVAEPRRWQRCEAGGVSAIALSDPAGPGAAGVVLDAWDLRTAFRWRAGEQRWMQLGRPRNEPGRRAGVIRAALAAQPGVRFVDAGNFVDRGTGVGDPGWKERREASYRLLRELDPVALGVGAAELGDGLPALLERATELPYVATNWTWTGEPGLPALRRMQVIGDPPLDVAFLGVTDPEAHAPGLAEAGVALVDPVEAVNAVVDELARSSSPPDVVVLLADVPPAVQAGLRGRLRGVDVFLGDPTAATLRVALQYTESRPVGASFKAAPITLPLDGIATAAVVLDPPPSWIAVEPLEVSAEAPVDRAVTEVATRLRAARAEALDRPLLPPEDPLAGVSEARWQRLVCEAVLEATGADVALLGGLPRSLPTPGPLTALQLADRLAGGHVVEVHRADGDRLKGFLYAAEGVAPIHCGAPTGQLAPKARGRVIDPLRTYRVATTDVTRQTTRLGDLLPQASSGLVGHLPQFRPLSGLDGSPLTLEALALAALADASAKDGWVEAWEARSASDVTPQVLLDLSRFSLRVQRFEGPHTDAYAAVPDSALNSPSSFTIGGDADLGLEVSSRSVLWDARFAATYTNFWVDGLPPQETADGWRVSSSVQLPVLALPPKTAFRVMPFAELGFDSEFTPGDDGAGGTLPRRADLSVFAGLSAGKVAGLKSLRLGPFVNRDLGQLDDKLTEFGGRFLGSTFHSPLPLSALWLTTAWDVQVFAPTAADDASDLRLRMWGEVRGSVRLVRSLSLALYVQGLLVQGRVAATSEPTGAVTAGLALDLAAALRLDVRPTLFPAPPRR
jgi:hypothetical protein